MGCIMFMHGWAKVTGPGLTGIAGFMAKIGLVPGTAFAVTAMFLEVVGGVCLIVGLFTRFFAAALAIEMAVAFQVVHFSQRFLRRQRRLRIRATAGHCVLRNRNARRRPLLR